MDDLQCFARDASMWLCIRRMYVSYLCVCVCSVQVFERCVGEGVVVCGGGCADTVAAGYLRDKVR